MSAANNGEAQTRHQRGLLYFLTWTSSKEWPYSFFFIFFLSFFRFSFFFFFFFIFIFFFSLIFSYVLPAFLKPENMTPRRPAGSTQSRGRRRRMSPGFTTAGFRFTSHAVKSSLTATWKRRRQHSRSLQDIHSVAVVNAASHAGVLLARGSLKHHQDLSKNLCMKRFPANDSHRSLFVVCTSTALYLHITILLYGDTEVGEQLRCDLSLLLRETLRNESQSKFL